MTLYWTGESLYIYATNDINNAFYGTLGMYPASELLIQMINYTEGWDGKDQKEHRLLKYECYMHTQVH